MQRRAPVDNEELTTTKEEVQSSNEELKMINFTTTGQVRRPVTSH